MGDAEVHEVSELVEDRFDDQSFDDAPLSDPESNFDEQELLSIDDYEPLVPTTDHLRLNEIRGRPALSTIPEESKTDDIMSNEVTMRSDADGRSSDLCNSGQSTISQAYSIKSSDFVKDQKASEVIQREQESFLRGHGLFIQDDPRFDRSHFEKENSWEPSIPDQSFGFTDTGSGIVPKPSASKIENVATAYDTRNHKDDSDNKIITGDSTFCHDVLPIKETEKPVAPLSESTNNLECNQVSTINDIRSTPQRALAKRLISRTENSPIPNDSSLVGAQTSTPVSMVAKLPSRQRLRDFDDMVLGISMIKADGGSAKEAPHAMENQSLTESTDTTMLSVGQIQSILKAIPSGSPSTLMRELEAQRKSRVKLRKPRSLLPTPSLKSGDAVQSSSEAISLNLMKSARTTSVSTVDCEATGRDVRSPLTTSRQCTNLTKSTICAPTNSSSNAPKTSASNHFSETSISQQSVFSRRNASQQREETSRNPKVADVKGTVLRAEVPTSRPESVRSGSSLSAAASARSVSQMSTEVSQRSVLFIPQHEVAFGCVAIGDTAIANVDVTNRTDHPLRIRAKLSNTENVFTLLDSQIILLDTRRTTTLRIEFCATQNARFCTSLSIQASGGGGPAVTYRMPVRGVGGTAVVTVKDREDLRISRSGSYVLQSSYESTFSFSLMNSGKRHAFARTLVLFCGESGISEQIPVDIRPARGVVIGRDESKQISVRLRSSLPFSDWRSSQNSIVSSASSNLRAVSPLQVLVYWGEERTRRRLRCFEQKMGITHTCEGLQFTDKYDGEDIEFIPPKSYPISKEDVRLFDQTLRMYTIYVCSPRIRPRQSLASNSSLDRSLQPEDTFRERTVYNTLVVPDQTLR
ncbi:hypothetical protein RB195_006154 [Necator americanus]